MRHIHAVSLFLFLAAALSGQELARANENPGGTGITFTLQDILEAPFRLEWGVTGGFGAAGLNSDFRSVLKKSGLAEWVFDPDTGGAAFSASPAAQLTWGALGMRWTSTFTRPVAPSNDFLPEIGANSESWVSDIITTIDLNLVLENFQLTNRLFFDPAETGYYHAGGVTLRGSNIEAGLKTISQYSAADAFLFFNGSFVDTVIEDAYFKASGLFGFLDLTIGGSGETILRLPGLFAEDRETYNDRLGLQLSPANIPGNNQALFDKPFATFTETIGTHRVFSEVTTFGKDMELLDLARVGLLLKFEWENLKVYNAWTIPTAFVPLRQWLAGDNIFDGSNNFKLGVQYTFPALAVVNAGGDLALEHRQELVFSAGDYYGNSVQHAANNRYWLDAKFLALDGLELLLGMDFQYRDVGLATVTGGNTVEDPLIEGTGHITSYSLGLDVRYQLDFLVPGMSVESSLMFNVIGSPSFQDLYGIGFDTIRSQLDAAYYLLPSLTEASFIRSPFQDDGAVIGIFDKRTPSTVPFVAALGIRHLVWESFSYTLGTTFLADSFLLDGSYFATAPNLPPVGYISENLISAGAVYQEQGVTIRLDVSYRMLVGLPSAADLGYIDSAVPLTTGSAEDQWESQSPARLNPWTITASYAFRF